MPAGSESHTYHTDKMTRCISDLVDKGHDEGSAHAICYTSLGADANKIEKSEDSDKPCTICEAIAKVRATLHPPSILAKDSKRRYTLGVVYEPDTLDTDNEFAKAEDIEVAAWDFMRSLQGHGEMAKAGLDLISKIKDAVDSDDEVKLEVTDELLEKIGKRGVNAMHIADLDNSEVVESFIAPTDMEIDGQSVKKGSWLAGIVWDEESFKKIEDGHWKGYSMGGRARKAAV